MRWLVAFLAWSVSTPVHAGYSLEEFEQDQRFARYCFIAGASAPLMLATSTLFREENPAAATTLSSTGVAISAVSLPLLGRRAMLAGDHLDLTGGKGAVALFFGIGTALSGAYYVAIDQNNASGFSYLAFSAASLTLGGLQLRQNSFVAEMRTDPNARLYLRPSPGGLTLSGTF